MAIAGNVSPRMVAHYSHVRLEGKRSALETISSRRSIQKPDEGGLQGYDTNNGTKPLLEVPFYSQVIEKNGGVNGTRTRGLCRDRTEFVCLALNQACHIRSTKLREFYGIPPGIVRGRS